MDDFLADSFLEDKVGYFAEEVNGSYYNDILSNKALQEKIESIVELKHSNAFPILKVAIDENIECSIVRVAVWEKIYNATVWTDPLKFEAFKERVSTIGQILEKQQPLGDSSSLLSSYSRASDWKAYFYSRAYSDIKTAPSTKRAHVKGLSDVQQRQNVLDGLHGMEDYESEVLEGAKLAFEEACLAAKTHEDKEIVFSRCHVSSPSQNDFNEFLKSKYMELRSLEDGPVQ